MSQRIELARGDITLQEVDAIVNAANASLMGGGGVDGAIHRRGGPAILEECRLVREQPRYRDGLPIGHAVATSGGALPARWVIHTVGPVYGRDDRAAELLASCHLESLAVADALDVRTIAFPAISTGAYGYPMDEAAPIAIRTVRETSTDVELIRFVLFGDDAYAAFEEALAS